MDETNELLAEKRFVDSVKLVAEDQSMLAYALHAALIEGPTLSFDWVSPIDKIACPLWYREVDSNHRPPDPQSGALTNAELRRHRISLN